MRSVNKVILIGNATRDAELRHTSSGKAVSSIRLATNRKVGENEETQFHGVVVRLDTTQRIAAGGG
jgi:single-strand DNA-binding protein